MPAHLSYPAATTAVAQAATVRNPLAATIRRHAGASLTRPEQESSVNIAVADEDSEVTENVQRLPRARSL
jgi:hypothetical protein